MVKQLIALVLVLVMPTAASAGPLEASMAKAAANAAASQADLQPRSRLRFWTSIVLLAGGGAMAALGLMEVADDEDGQDDGEDLDDSDDGEDADGWGNKALIGGGIASAALGGTLLLTGRKSGPVVTIRPGNVSVRHTIRF